MADNESTKLKAITLAWDKLNKQLAFVETLENRTTVLVCGFLIAFPVFLLTNDVDLTKNVKFSVRILDVFAGLVIASAIITGWFQYTNNKRARWLCRSLVRIEQVLHYYDPEHYITKKQLESLKENYPDISMGITESTLLDPEGQKWGKYRGWQLYFLQHIGALVLATMASFIMLYFLV